MSRSFIRDVEHHTNGWEEKENYLAFHRSPNSSRISKYNKQCLLKEYSTRQTSLLPGLLAQKGGAPLHLAVRSKSSAITVSLRALPAPGPDSAALGTPGSQFPFSRNEWALCCLTAPVPQRYSPALV